MENNTPKLDSLTLLREINIDSHKWATPRCLDLSSEDDLFVLNQLIDGNKIIGVYDQLELIASDLFEMRNPQLKNENLKKNEFIQDIVNQGIAYGKWFYYPWSGHLVHFPDLEDYRDLRTARNRNLITSDEQKKLYSSKIAIFGLSVGSNIVERLVSSGIGGTVIIGDPDHIEPTNLNRINGRFSDIGSTKIGLMARKISELDPYIDQIHFPQGVNSTTLEELKEFMPDVIFDEVDDLGAKAEMRFFAKAHKIPLIMVTDLGDRSLLDIERYDIEDAKPFNGKIKQKDFEKILSRKFTDDERSKFIAKIIGIRYVSTRMLESIMLLNNNELSGMPQLGATASAGASLAVFASREIILGRKIKSGRYDLSPRKTLELDYQSTIGTGIKTIYAFAKSQKRLKNK